VLDADKPKEEHPAKEEEDENYNIGNSVINGIIGFALQIN